MTDADRVFSDSSAESANEHRATYDWDATEPSTAVVEAVADATDRDSLALPQLYGAVESDALDSLVRLSDSSISVSFAFADCDVTVRSDGEVVVQPSSPGDDAGQ